MTHRRPPRIRGFDYIGEHAYFVTVCTYKRRRWFEEAPLVDAVLGELLHTAEECAFAVVVYCFMPDHVHLVVEGRDGASDLRRFVKTFKQRAVHSTRELRQAPLWQGGYYEHVIRGDETTSKVARYVLDNPVRAGLANDPEGYPYSGSGVCSVHDILVGLT